MLSVTNQTMIATVRTAAIYLWTYLSSLLISWLGTVEGAPELVASLGDFLTGDGVVLFIGTAIYAVLFKAAQMNNALGGLISFVFIFPQQPAYAGPDIVDPTNIAN